MKAQVLCFPFHQAVERESEGESDREGRQRELADLLINNHKVRQAALG